MARLSSDTAIDRARIGGENYLINGYAIVINMPIGAEKRGERGEDEGKE